MGLTSGQGRLLMLTSRLSDIQLDEILISQRQNQLAWQSEKVAKEYNEKISNKKLVMKVNDSSTNIGYTKQDLTYENMTSMGYIVTDASGNIYLTKDDKGWNIPKASNLSNKDIFDGDVTTNEAGESVITYNKQERKVIDGTEILSDKNKLQTALMNGTMFVLNTTGNDTSGLKLNQLESNTSVEWVNDTSDDAEAESKYNYETARISRQDNNLELDMKQLETQHNAIAKEIESVKKVIDDNVERTFKLFDGG